MVLFTKPEWLQHVASAHGVSAARRRRVIDDPEGATAAGAAAPSKVPLFSIDVQPLAAGADAEAARVATAGQDGRVMLWRLGALLADARRVAAGDGPANASDVASAIPPGALLAVLSSPHQGAANVVRWRGDGAMLATGGDDGTVMLHVRASAAGSAAVPFGSGLPADLSETWRCCRVLRGHDSDVLDVCFSPCGAMLASCSVDNSVCVWAVDERSASQTSTVSPLVARLSGHQGMVKGVAWDPTGRFLASQSDDRSVVLWRTDHWGQIERRLVDEFASAVTEANLRSWFMRLAWSPSGAELVATNSYQKKCHVAPLYRRSGDFRNPIEFVGHRAPVVSVRWSSCLYSRSPSPPYEGPNRLYFCVALGSKDRGLTVWRADHKRPFFSLADVFDDDVQDLSWSADGRSLVACSTDGSAFLVHFEPDELGYVVPPAVQQAELRREMALLSGAAVPDAGRDGWAPSEVLMRADVFTPSALALQGKQREVLARLQAPQRESAGDRPRSAPAIASATPERSRAASASRPNGETATASSVMSAAKAQREERRDGKRRIIPVALDAPTVTMAGAAVPNGHAERMTPTATAIAPIQSASAAAAPDARPGVETDIATPSGAPVRAVKTKRKRRLAPADAADGARSAATTTPSLATTEEAAPGERAANAAAEAATTALPLLLPRASDATAKLVRVVRVAQPSITLEAQADAATHRHHTRLHLARDGVCVWTQVLAGRVVGLECSEADAVVWVATDDACVQVLSLRSGLRLHPPLALDAEVAWMGADRHRWMVLTRDAAFYVYEMQAPTADGYGMGVALRLRRSGSARFLLHQGVWRSPGRVPVFRWHEARDAPLLVSGNGHAYLHAESLRAWLRLADDHYSDSEFFPRYDGSKAIDVGRLDAAAPLRLEVLQEAAAAAARMTTATPILRAAPGEDALPTLAHLETLCNAACALRDAAELQYWLGNLVLRLTTEADEARLVEIGDALLGAPAASEGKEWQPTILGIDKRALLRDTLLPIITTNASLEGVVSAYSQALAMLPPAEGDSGGGVDDTARRRLS
ncbi:hypothetical protein CDCA_CDCA05G1482 [Cyanidium caldarium]|uniref:Protein HIRA n=1 Tax=Cyanidium caldarium TaxID=2771 RepID=A0AAV9IT10_CYACA|nr:hypothetical protein CDCA_CDCA05G1482 [Cyanidium caldarium]